MPPPSSNTSHPVRGLFSLAAVIVVLLLAIVGHGGALASPGKWGGNFKVHLGLDLTGGTELVLRADTSHGKAPGQSEMATAVAIMLNRVDASGTTNAQVQQQGNNTINVSVPGKLSLATINLVSQTAELDFRQVLLAVVNTVPPTPKTSATPTTSPSAGSTATPRPGASGSGSPSATPTATPSSSAKATAKPSASSSSNAAAAPGVAGPSGVTEMDRDASILGARSAARSGGTQPQARQATPGATAPSVPVPTAPATGPPTTPTTPTTPTASTSPGCVPTKVPKNLAPAKNTGMWEDAMESTTLGVPSQVNCHTKELFNHLNCNNPKWWNEVGYSPQDLNGALAKDEVVSCGKIDGTGPWYKYALDPVAVQGTQISSASASLEPNNTTGWEVVVNFHSLGAKQFGTITTKMYDEYHCAGTTSACPANNYLAAVLDGLVVNAPNIETSITGGSAEISPFTQSQASLLAQQLSYGALPLTFQKADVDQVSPQLGKAQLDAGLIAAALGLILVVLYMIFYYRGLAVVAISSLVIAGLLAYLGVVALGWYQGFSLDLAGVAGLIVAIGITADSFVVFFERLRDEVREGGRSLRAAVEKGWGRARRTILVSDTVSFLAAAVLYYFTVGDVKGFAFTLGMITVIDVLVVFTFTKPMMTLLAQTKFYGGGHRWSGLDPGRLGARAPWRGGQRAAPARPARPATARAVQPGPAKEA